MKDRMTALLEFLADDPDDSFTRYALALEYLSRNDVERGITMLRETLHRDPAYIPAYQQLGQALHRAGAVDQAILCYQEGITMAKRQNDAHAATEMTQELEDIQEEQS